MEGPRDAQVGTGDSGGGHEDGQGDFPVRGSRCVTWPTAVVLKERQLTLSWEPMRTHGHASTL